MAILIERGLHSEDLKHVSPKASRVLERSEQEARMDCKAAIETGHLLLGLSRDALIKRWLDKVQLESGRLRTSVQLFSGRGSEFISSGDTLSGEVRDILKSGIEFAKKRNRQVRSSDFLRAIVEHPTSVASQILASYRAHKK